MHTLAQLAEQFFGLTLTRQQLAQFEQYEQALLEWNARFNLTAIRQPEEMRLKHFLDSLSCWPAMQGAPIGRVIDVGSGAGFPGLPLKIARPELNLTLVESVQKKADFCRYVADLLELEGVAVLSERVETLGQMPAHREHYDWALARAVAEMPILVEYLLPLVRICGCMLAMKGAGGLLEAQAAGRAIAALGGQLRQLYPIHLPGIDKHRYLVVVEKTSPTPPAYPRRVGMPAKRPIR
jgi:16S rRNA (guanine527-N7)-methyltransferase